MVLAGVFNHFRQKGRADEACLYFFATMPGSALKLSGDLPRGLQRKQSV